LNDFVTANYYFDNGEIKRFKRDSSPPSPLCLKQIGECEKFDLPSQQGLLIRDLAVTVARISAIFYVVQPQGPL
jgi:hypothetical protein